MSFFDLDWHRMFSVSQPILETFIRGSCMYLAMFALLRVFRRQTGAEGTADLLVLLLIADAAQNGLAGEYRSITDGVLLIVTIIFWEYVLDWLAFRFKIAEKIIERNPLLLVKDGKIQTKNLAVELITLDDLMAQLRKKGVDDPKRVRCCYLEGDGHVSVITDGGNCSEKVEEENRF